MSKIIPVTIVVYCTECTVARYYLEYLRLAGYAVEKILIFRDCSPPTSMGWLWKYIPRLLIAVLRTRKTERERCRGDLRRYIKYCSTLFDAKISLGSDFSYNKYASNIQTELVKGFYDPKVERILCEQENKVFLYTCGGIVNRELLNIAGAKFIHIHPGVVPSIKGSDGFWWSLLINGKCGASCFYMNDGIDTGDLIMTGEYSLPEISLKDKFPREIIHKGALLAIDPHVRAMLLLEVVRRYESDIGNIAAKRQDPEAGSYYFHMHSLLKDRIIDVQWK